MNHDDRWPVRVERRDQESARAGRRGNVALAVIGGAIALALAVTWIKPPGGQWLVVAAPLLAVVAAPALAYWFVPKYPPGKCVECGFDLQGLPAESHRCPECGAAVGR